MARVTIKDIAREVGVSHPTVSKALANLPGVSEETRKRIFEAADRMNYVPNMAAQRLAKRKSRSIGFIWNNTENLFLYHLCTKLQSETEKRNIDLLITMCNPGQAINSLYNHCIDYMFCWGRKDIPGEKKLKDFKKNGCGLMFMGGGVVPGADSLIIDRFKGMYDTVAYLKSCGHKRVAFFGMETDKKSGFVSGMKELDMDYTDKNVEEIMSDYYSDYKEYETEIYNKFSLIWNSECRPTALILDSQNLAMGFINVFKKLGISIPEDLSLITYDDIPEYSVYPVKLTTISPSLGEISEKILERFEMHYNGAANEDIAITIVPRITKRESVKNLNENSD